MIPTPSVDTTSALFHRSTESVNGLQKDSNGVSHHMSHSVSVQPRCCSWSAQEHVAATQARTCRNNSSNPGNSLLARVSAIGFYGAHCWGVLYTHDTSTGLVLPAASELEQKDSNRVSHHCMSHGVSMQRRCCSQSVQERAAATQARTSRQVVRSW